jgi:hypothetical protein
MIEDLRGEGSIRGCSCDALEALRQAEAVGSTALAASPACVLAAARRAWAHTGTGSNGPL